MKTVELKIRDLAILKYIVNNGFSETFENCLGGGKGPCSFKRFTEFCYKVGLDEQFSELRS